MDRFFCLSFCILWSLPNNAEQLSRQKQSELETFSVRVCVCMNECVHGCVSKEHKGSLDDLLCQIGQFQYSLTFLFIDHIPFIMSTALFTLRSNVVTLFL